MDYQARHRREGIEISRTESAIIEGEWWGGRKLRLLAWNMSFVGVPQIISAYSIMGIGLYRHKAYVVRGLDRNVNQVKSSRNALSR